MPGEHKTPTIALQQVTSKYARDNAAKTLDKPLGLSILAKHLAPSDLDELRTKFPDGKLHVWGSKFERIHQFDRMIPGHSLVLFRRETVVYKSGVIAKWLFDRALGEFLWGLDTDNEPWSLVFVLSSVKDRHIAASEINRAIGRNPDDHWQGMVVISPPLADSIVAYLRQQQTK